MYVKELIKWLENKRHSLNDSFVIITEFTSSSSVDKYQLLVFSYIQQVFVHSPQMEGTLLETTVNIINPHLRWEQLPQSGFEWWQWKAREQRSGVKGTERQCKPISPFSYVILDKYINNWEHLFILIRKVKPCIFTRLLWELSEIHRKLLCKLWSVVHMSALTLLYLEPMQRVMLVHSNHNTKLSVKCHRKRANLARWEKRKSLWRRHYLRWTSRSIKVREERVGF